MSWLVAFRGWDGAGGAIPRRTLVALFALALALRLAFLGAFYALPHFFTPESITDQWDTIARNLLHAHTLGWGAAPATPTITRTPVYPAFLAALMWVTGGRYALMRLLYLLLDAAVALLVVWTGRRVLPSQRAALAGGFVYALCPLPAWHICKLAADAFLGAVLLGALALFLGGVFDVRGARWRWVVVSGLAAGVAILTKKTILLLVPVWLVFMLVRHRFARRAVGVAAVYALAAAVVLAPWVVRNSRLAGRAAPLQTLTWTVYWYGEFVDAHAGQLGGAQFNRDARDYVTDLAGDGLWLPAYALTVRQDLSREATLRRLAMAHIRGDPAHAAARTARNVVRFWYLTETGRMTRYTAIAGAGFFLLFAAGVLILIRKRRWRWNAALVLATVLYFNFAYAPFFTVLRYMIPVTPLISIFCGVTVWRLIPAADRVSSTAGGRRGVCEPSS